MNNLKLFEKAMSINMATTDELNEQRSNLFEKLIQAGADPDDLLTMNSITIELTIRDLTKRLVEEL